MRFALTTVKSALASQLDAALTVPVYNGPTPTGDAPLQYVLVGATDDGQDGATFELTDPSRSAELDDEGGEIQVSCVAKSGDVDIPTLDTAASELVSDCVDAINADRTLGGALPAGSWVKARRGNYHAWQTPDGPMVRITFTVQYLVTLV